MPNYGVIDLGSNTIRMVVFDVKDDHLSTYTSKDFKSLRNDKIMAGLASHVVDGAFAESGVRKAVSVLKSHLKHSRYYGCKRLDVFATAVLRNCSNSAQAIAQIEQQTGLAINLLSARDEAHLGFVGATCDRAVTQGTLIDIGGGSTELTRIAGGEDFDDVSLPQGSLSSYTQNVAAILPDCAEMDAIAQRFQQKVRSLERAAIYQTDVLYGIGGSVRAAAKIHAELNGQATRPKVLTPDDLREILNLCRTDPNRFAHAALKAVPERVHTLVPGCVIAYELMQELMASSLELCKYGVREGYLLERMLA